MSVSNRGSNGAFSLVIYNVKMRYCSAHYISVTHYRLIFLLLRQTKVNDNTPWITTPGQFPLIKFPSGQLSPGFCPAAMDSCP